MIGAIPPPSVVKTLSQVRYRHGMDESAGRVVEINISPMHEELPESIDRVPAVAGRGLRGDRNFLADGSPGRGAMTI